MKRTVAVKDEAGCPSEPDAKRAKTQEVVEAESIFELNATEFECVICFDLLVDPVVGKCGHDFCKACLEDWRHKQHTGITAGLGLHTTCPVCRKDVGLNNSTRRNPDELGVCIRLKELIERLFPKRSKDRRSEVEAEEEERKRRREQERQEQQRQAQLHAQQRQAAQRNMQQMLYGMQYPVAPVFTNLGVSGRETLMRQLQHQARLQRDLLQFRVPLLGNLGGGGEARDSNAGRGAVGGGGAQQQLRRNERLRSGTYAAAGARAGDDERARRNRHDSELLDAGAIADVAVAVRRGHQRGRWAELRDAWAGAGQGTAVQQAAAEPGAVNPEAAPAAGAAGEGAATDEAIAAPAAASAAPQQGLGSSAGQPASAAEPAEADVDLPPEPVDDLSPDMSALHVEHGRFSLADFAGGDAYRASAAAGSRAVHQGLGSAVAAEAAAVASQQRQRRMWLLSNQQGQLSGHVQEGQRVLDGALRLPLLGARDGTNTAEQGSSAAADFDRRLQRMREARGGLHSRLQLGNGGETGQQAVRHQVEWSTEPRQQQQRTSSQQQQLQPAGMEIDRQQPQDPAGEAAGYSNRDDLVPLSSSRRTAASAAAEARALDMPDMLFDLPSDAALQPNEYDGATPNIDDLLDQLFALESPTQLPAGDAPPEHRGQESADVPDAAAAAAVLAAWPAADASELVAAAAAALAAWPAADVPEAAAAAVPTAWPAADIRTPPINFPGVASAATTTRTAAARNQGRFAVPTRWFAVPDSWRAPPLINDRTARDAAGGEGTADVLLRRSRAIAAAGAQTAAQQRRRLSARRSCTLPEEDAAAATVATREAGEVASRLHTDNPLADTAGTSGAAGAAAAAVATAGRGGGTVAATGAAASAARARSTAVAQPAVAAGPAAAAACGATSEREQGSTDATASVPEGWPVPVGLGSEEGHRSLQQLHRSQAAAGRRYSSVYDDFMVDYLFGSRRPRGRPHHLVAHREGRGTVDADVVQRISGEECTSPVEAQLEDPTAAHGGDDAAWDAAARRAASHEVELLQQSHAAIAVGAAAAAAADGTSNGSDSAVLRTSAPAAAAAAAAAATAAEGSGGRMAVGAAGRAQQIALQPAASGDLAREVARETSTAVARAVARQIRREVLPQLRSGPPRTVVDGGYISSDTDDA